MDVNEAVASTSVESSFTPTAFSALCASYITIGAATSLFGPLLNAIATTFHQSLPSAGAVLSVYFIGGFIGVLVGWRLTLIAHGRIAAIGGLGAMATGSLAIVIATHFTLWTAFLGGAAFIGVGFGILDFALNTILARTAEAGRAGRLSLANSFWGVGSIVGPLVILALHPHNFPLIFGVVGLTSLGITPWFRGLHAPALRSDVNQVDVQLRRAQRPILVTFIVAYVLYVGVETTASGWLAANLHGVGYAQSVGSLATAGFWVGLTLARALGGPLHRLFSKQHFVLGGLTLTALLSLVANIHALAPVAFPLIGLCLANVYVFGILWFQSLVGTNNRGVAIIVVWTMAGGVLGPGLTSALVSLTSIRAVPWSLAGQAIATLGVFIYSRRFRAVTTLR